MTDRNAQRRRSLLGRVARHLGLGPLVIAMRGGAAARPERTMAHAPTAGTVHRMRRAEPHRPRARAA